MRGRLHNVMLAEIARLDVPSTEGDPDGAGPLQAGYDDVFREVVLFSRAGVRTSARQEQTVFVPCQTETTTMDALLQRTAGNDPIGKIALVFHKKDLEPLGLMDGTTGEARLRVNDRLVSFRDKYTQALVHTLGSGGYFCTEVRSTFGLSLGHDLFVATYEIRSSGAVVG